MGLNALDGTEDGDVGDIIEGKGDGDGGWRLGGEVSVSGRDSVMGGVVVLCFCWSTFGRRRWSRR